MKKYFIILSVLVASLGLSAQDLHKEITVDRTVQPDIREASRLKGITPSILQPEIRLKRLSAAEYTRPGEITQDLSILPPSAWRDSITHAPYRGYASVGYLPLYNLGANAGYRFVDTPKYGLGLWLQYNGESYNGDIPYFDGALFTNHVATLGGNASARFGKNSLLTASGNVTYKSIRTPYFLAVDGNEFRRSYTQTAKDIGAKAMWQSRLGGFTYNIKGALGYFDLGDDINKEIRRYHESVRQALVDFGMGFGVADEGRTVPWIGFDADLKVLRSTNLPVLMSDYRERMTVGNLWLGSFKPFLRFDNDVLQGLIGFNLTAGKGYEAKMKVAPWAQIDYRPANPLRLYAKVSGGQHLNLMSDLVDLNPYLMPTRAYGRTNMPLVLNGGINIGPYDGMSLGIFGGYAQARDYLTPLITILRNGHMESSFELMDVDSWCFGAELGYAYKQLFVLTAGVKSGGSDKGTNSWYEWADGAKTVANVGLKITALEDFEIDLSYDMRYDRKVKSVIYPYGVVNSQVFVGIPNLGTINSVNIGATYRINDQITAFLQADNLLNTRYKLISGMAGPGIHGLLGVSCKF